MNLKLEHANLTVTDIDDMVRFLRTAFPNFRVRHDEGEGTDRWVHVGTDDYYIALNQAGESEQERRVLYSKTPGFNHLAWQIDDADGLRKRLLEAGFKDSTLPNSHPFRKRVYFFDPDGNEWEFVEYLSEEPAERNDYELAG